VILYVWATRGTTAQWPVLITQVLSFLAIPVQGAHFLTDMLAGAVVGVGAIAASGVLVALAKGVQPAFMATEPAAGRLSPSRAALRMLVLANR